MTTATTTMSTLLAGVLLLAGLTACAIDQAPEPPAPASSGRPTFYEDLAQTGAEVDTASAASMISGYRRNNGLSGVSANPLLMKAAAAQARAMASRNQLEHNVAGEFSTRIRGSGYDAKLAAENIGAGYRTLADAISGWRGSPSHRENMLLKGATHFGIAAAYAPGSKYKVFWALILAAPDKPSTSGKRG
jgi:uncharacterized protein YkwD